MNFENILKDLEETVANLVVVSINNKHYLAVESDLSVVGVEISSTEVQESDFVRYIMDFNTGTLKQFSVSDCSQVITRKITPDQAILLSGVMAKFRICDQFREGILMNIVFNTVLKGK